jgi:hypothetical protein
VSIIHIPAVSWPFPCRYSLGILASPCILTKGELAAWRTPSARASASSAAACSTPCRATASFSSSSTRGSSASPAPRCDPWLTRRRRLRYNPGLDALAVAVALAVLRAQRTHLLGQHLLLRPCGHPRHPPLRRDPAAGLLLRVRLRPCRPCRPCRGFGLECARPTPGGPHSRPRDVPRRPSQADDVRDRVDGFVFLLYQVRRCRCNWRGSPALGRSLLLAGALDVPDLLHQLHPQHDLVPRDCR